jgi:hypothetical protein
MATNTSLTADLAAATARHTLLVIQRFLSFRRSRPRRRNIHHRPTQFPASCARSAKAQVQVLDSSGNDRLLTGEAVLETPELLPGFAIPVKEVFEP